MKKLLVSALLTLTMAAGAAGTVLAASADDAFAADSEGSAVFPAGRSEEEVLAALDEKVADLNADIKAVIDADGDLEEAYADGEILAYSIASGSDGTITAANKRSGWKVWEGTAVIDLKYINDGYSGWGDNYVAWLSYNGIDDEAYIITGKFADQYQKDSSQKLGSAAGDMFRVDTAGGGVYRLSEFHERLHKAGKQSDERRQQKERRSQRRGNGGHGSGRRSDLDGHDRRRHLGDFEKGRRRFRGVRAGVCRCL